MNILMVSSFLPHPLYSGGHVRLFNIIKQLSKNHSITLICEKRSNQSQNDIDVISKYCERVITFGRKKQWSLPVVLSTAFSKYPFLMVGHTQQEMKKKIDEITAKEFFDVIHVETFYIMHNIPQVSVPIVLVEHNIEYLVYERFSRESSSFLSPLLKHDIKKIKKWEEYYWEKADRLVAVSEQDKSIMKRKDSVVVPNGVDLVKFRVPHFAKASRDEQSSKFKVENEERRILFIGDFKWIQNRDAVQWILKDIWPKITANSKLLTQNSKLWIVGKNIPKSIKDMGEDKTIIFDESAEDTAELFQKAYILLAPIRVGGGTSFKILEAMASGIPVVTTGIGAQGLEAVAGKELLIAEDTRGMVNHILQLLHSTSQYESIAYNARKLIEKEYDWRAIVEKLESVYMSVVQPRT